MWQTLCDLEALTGLGSSREAEGCWAPMEGRRDDARIEDGSDTDSDKTQDGSCMPGLPHYRLRPDLLRRADVLAKAVRGLRVAEPTLGVTLLLANIRAGAEEESEAVAALPAADEGGAPPNAALSLACIGCARLPSDMDDDREKHEVCPICVKLNVPTAYWCCVNCPGNPGAWKRHAVYHKEVKVREKRGFDRGWAHQAISEVADVQADRAEQSGDRYLQLLANGADYASRHDWRRACLRYREAIALRINLPEAYFNLALLLVPSGQLVEAAQWFLAAKERLPVDSKDWATATACAFEMLRQEECNEVAKPEWWDDELLKVLSARVVRANETVASATGPAHRMRATVLCGLYGAWASPPRSTAELTEARMHFVSAAGLCTAAVGRAELETAATLCGQLALAISLAEAELAAEVKAEAERAVEVKAEAERAAARAVVRAAEAKLAEVALQRAASTVDLEGIRQVIAAHATAAEGSSALRAAREARDRLAEQQRKAAKEAKQAAKRDQKRREEEARAADEEEAAATAAAVAEATAAERAAAHALAVERDGRVRAAAERVAAERAAAERAAAERAARDRLAEQQRQAAKEAKQAAKRDQKRREEEARAADEEKAAATAAAVVAERAAAHVLAAEREQVRRATAKREAERSAAERAAVEQAAADRAAAEQAAEGARAQQAAEEARTMAEAIERSMASLQASYTLGHSTHHRLPVFAPPSPTSISTPRPCAGRRRASQPGSTRRP